MTQPQALTAQHKNLVRDQSLLLQCLCERDDPALLLGSLQKSGKRAALASRGLQAYQANAGALAERALQATYPVVAQLLGDESFPLLARHYWQSQPPQRGDVSQWGVELPGFLDALPQLADEPFLADVARVEWALHAAVTAQDAKPDPASFSSLASCDAEKITLCLSHGVAMVASAYPVVSLVHAHLHGEPTLSQAAARLNDGVGEIALVWRDGFKPCLRQVSPAEHDLVSALQAGMSLDAALSAACAPQSDHSAPMFDFNDWLSQAVQTGLVTGVQLLLLSPVHQAPQHTSQDPP